VELGSACNYAILAEAGITNVPNSFITGDIAVSPLAAGSITGMGLVMDASGEFSTSTEFTGKAFAANYAAPTPGRLTTAVGSMQAAYTAASNRQSTDTAQDNLGGGAIGGKTLTPGVYTFTVNVNIASDLTFEGGANDVFIIKTTMQLIQAANTKVILSGGAQAKNIFWQVAGYVEIGADASMKGIILTATKVTFITGSSLVGSVLAQTTVALQMATITRAAGTCTAA
jgi:hypothetical protein